MQKALNSNFELRGRGLTLDGAKAFVKLDSASWKAIDMLAAANGIDWSDWVRAVWAGVKASVPRDKVDEINRAGALRAVAIAQLVQWIETQGAMLRHYQDRAGESNRIEVALSNDVAVVLDEEGARNIADHINRALHLKNGGGK